MESARVTSDFWRRLAKAMGRELPLPQKDVAAHFAVRQSAVTKWKTGKDTPKLWRVRKMAQEFNVNTDWLLNGTGAMRPGNAGDQEMAALQAFWGELNRDSRQKILDFAIYQKSRQTGTSPPPLTQITPAAPDKSQALHTPISKRQRP